MNKDLEQENPENWKLDIFYFNKKDPRFIVPKRLKILGWTFNFARPISYVLMGLIIAFVIYQYLKK